MNNEIILLVEDNPDDELLTLKELKRHNIINEVIVAHDGQEALDYLFGEDSYKGRDANIKPVVILLDLGLPKIDGLEVLRRTRADGRTKKIPVFVLTSSDKDENEIESFHMGATSFIRKPVNFNQLAEAIKSLNLCWQIKNIADYEVAKRKRAEELLKESEEKYHSLIANIPSVTWITNANGKKTFISPNIEKVYGYTPKEVCKAYKSLWFGRIHPEDVKFVKEAYNNLFRNGNQFDIEYRIKRKDGEWIWLHDKAVTTYEKGGANFAYGVFSDITDRKKAEEILEHYVKELEKSNDELKQFAYVASHDLQEPLRMVSSFTRLLAERYKSKLDSDADDFITYAVDGAERMQTLISDLLDYSRERTQRRDLEPTNLKNVIGQALDNLKILIEENDAVVNTKDALPTVLAESSQLTRLFQNLINNAIKFRSERVPKIKVGVKSKKSEWLFSVKDNGIGIAPEFKERIFDIFRRLHSKEEYSGTGIGLAICKKIVTGYDGRIWVESEQGKGSTFYFTIPKVVKSRVGRLRVESVDGRGSVFVT